MDFFTYERGHLPKVLKKDVGDSYQRAFVSSVIGLAIPKDKIRILYWNS